jgi:hypothetical protein
MTASEEVAPIIPQSEAPASYQWVTVRSAMYTMFASAATKLFVSHCH